MPENEQDTALNPEPPIANTVGQGLENEVPQDTALNAEPPKAEERPKGLTPWEHGRLTGHVRDGRTVFAGQDPEPIRSPEFRAAEVLHGWSAHSQHTASPLYITREAFESAIEAAKNANEKTGRYTPHAEALAPHLQTKGNA